jgi:hypothetical protein
LEVSHTYKNQVEKHEKKSPPLGDLGTDGRIIKCVFKEEG